jgi:uncharacterized phage protein gp47/JayE
MPLAEKSFDEFVDDQVNAMQAVANQLLDFTDGSVMRAIVESNAGNSLFLEALYAFLLSVTRFMTSFGQDADTWGQQFQFYRVPATPAFGTVTFSRSVTTQQAVIPSGNMDGTIIGAIVYSSISMMNYFVYADTTNDNYDPDLNAYIIPIGISSIDVPIVAQNAGTAGNVLANDINIISTPIAYVDTVTNALALANGQNSESDAAYKTRFILYINSLSKATQQALQEAIKSVPGVARYQLIENVDIDDNPYLGFFYVVIDDGTGNASSDLIGDVQAAVYATRGFTIAESVYGPTQFLINITVHVFTDGSVPDVNVQAAVVTALQNYILSLSFNSLYAWSEIASVVYQVNSQFYPPQSLSPIINVTDWTQNSSTADITLTGKNIGVPGTITVVMNA